MYKLRDYQERALTELNEWLRKHEDGNPVVDMAVGSGKSVVIAEFCKRAIEQYPETRIIMCVASKELCQQNAEKLLAIWNDAPVGICSASLGQKDTDSQIIFATIGSIARRASELGKVHLLIIDECHNVNPDNSGQYRDFISDLHKYGSPHLCTIGFTGTPFRGDGVWLWQGKDPLFKGTATRVSMTELLEQGYLAPLIVEGETPELIDTSNVRILAGDYQIKELESLVMNDELITETVTDIIQRSGGLLNRKKWLIYCVTIEHAEAVLAEIKSRKIIHANMITGSTRASLRDAILNDYKLPHHNPDSIDCLVSVGCLTTGFDAPETDLIALLRPTKSPVLYVQIAGRGMRIAPNKKDCLWLDYTSTTADLGAVNLIKGRNKRESGGDAPYKNCENCGNPNTISAIECIECGQLFPEPEIKDPHSSRAGNLSPLQGIDKPKPPEWVEIKSIAFHKHAGKNGKPPTMRIDYYFNDFEPAIKEWKCFEHEGFALRKGVEWWNEHISGITVPFTIDEALHIIHDFDTRITTPSAILVGENKSGYQEIKQYRYESKQATIISNAPTTELIPF